jgi:hypothetical protein
MLSCPRCPQFSESLTVTEMDVGKMLMVEEPAVSCSIVPPYAAQPRSRAPDGKLRAAGLRGCRSKSPGLSPIDSHILDETKTARDS